MSTFSTEREAIDRLRLRYDKEAWALFPQVPDGTGASKRRTADAIAMSLWPSRGLEIHGFEVKVTRADWLSELKLPAKAESISRFCDRWWIVAGDPKIVKAGELPKGWGLMVAHGDGLKIKTQAMDNAPMELTREFIAGLFRAASQYYSDPNFASAEIKRKYKEGVDDGKMIEKSQSDWHARQHESLRKTVDRFRKTSGVNIESWEGGSIADAVAALMDGSGKALSYQADEIIRSCEIMAKNAAKLKAVFDQKRESHAG